MIMKNEQVLKVLNYNTKYLFSKMEWQPNSKMYTSLKNNKKEIFKQYYGKEKKLWKNGSWYSLTPKLM